MAFLFLTACSSKPVIMTHSDVTVSRDEAAKKCKELGTVRGTTLSIHGTAEEAVEEMKKEAARKGANYVQMQAMGANTNSVSGIAYSCP